MINQVKRQSKINSKGKAITSLVLGIISMGPFIIAKLLIIIAPIPQLGPIVSTFFFQIGPLIAIIGLVLGIMGLKSTKRNFAIAGIILCLIGLLVPLYYFLFY